MEVLSMDPPHDSQSVPMTSDLSPQASGSGKSPNSSEESKYSCPSPLVTEPADEDDDFGGPSSVEAEANSSDGGFDLDVGDIPDIPEPSYPLSNPRRNSYQDGPDGDNDPESNFGGILDLFESSATQGCCNNTEQEENIKSETAVAGLCGFANFANTCYMNSGLQCLLATPTVVKYFTECYKSKSAKVSTAGSPKSAESLSSLTDHFGPLLQNVWAGEFRQLKPVDFKETLADNYPQFRGTQQHDCQEFLTLLLDTLHEELKAESHDQSDCGTSMELHTPHSTEKSAPLSVGWISRHSSFDNGSAVAESSCSKKVMAAVDPIPDGTESRGSPAGSPKSFDSHSSLEDKVASAIRHCPIPREMKAGIFLEEDSAAAAAAEEDDDTMDSLAGSSGGAGSTGQPTSNLIPTDNLKRANVVRFSDEGTTKSAVSTTAINNSGNTNTALTINDYMKESKTLNVNVLADDDEEMNNEISFDSGKFLRHDKIRLRETIDNLSNVDADEMATSVSSKLSHSKRVKVTNETTSSTEPEATNGEDPVAACSYSSGASDENSRTCSADGSCDFNGIKRIRLDSSDKEKNVQLERERQQQQQQLPGDGVIPMDESCLPPSDDSLSVDPMRLKEAIEADRFWEKYLANNDTIVARTFQGQFKNTVVCTVCNFVSVSFEPFMYLPVPLPNAHILQLEVTFVSRRPFETPKSLLLNLSHADNASVLKEKVGELVGVTSTANFSLVEVFDHHISRTVDDWMMLKHLKDDRLVYVVDVLGGDNNSESKHQLHDQPSTSAAARSCSSSSAICDDAGVSSSSDIVPEHPVVDGQRNSADQSVVSSTGDASTNSPVPEPTTEYQSCVICMEDLPVDQMRQHNACDCVMCCPCIERTIEHHQSDMDLENASAAFLDGQIKCPGCRQDADPSTEFITLDMVGKSKPRLRTFTLPVVHRLESSNIDGDANYASPSTSSGSRGKTSVTIFGHPTLVRVPNCVTGVTLHQLLEPINPLKGAIFEYVLVNVQGRGCARCIFSAHCRGCIRIKPSDSTKEIMLQPSDSIALSFTGNFLTQDDLNRATLTDPHVSMNQPRLPSRLDLSDCLSAFSEKEVLDESNPWFCPVCRKHQCATKTLTIWRFPDFLIIYLKRFVYINNSTGSLKLDKSVDFQVNNLDLTQFLSGPLQADSEPIFNLYGCVCHFGSVGGGHYTAFARHLATGLWNYFDDGSISEGKVPGEAAGDNSSAYILFYQRAGSRCDTQLPALGRQCRAFALESNPAMTNGCHDEMASTSSSSMKPEVEMFLADASIQADDEEEEETRPDLSQIIRSLDTPPPS